MLDKVSEERLQRLEHLQRRTRDVEDGAASWEEKRETTEKIHGCSDEGYAEDWCGKRGC